MFLRNEMDFFFSARTGQIVVLELDIISDR